MSKPKYLYITEGGERFFTSDDEPTPHDKKCVEVGITSIIRLEDAHDLKQDGTWAPITKGVLKNIPDLELGPYHTEPETK